MRAETTTDPDDALLWRRVLVFGVWAISWAGLAVGMAGVLAREPGNGGSALRVVVLGLFVLAAPWSLLVVWNSVIGLVILLGSRVPASVVNPALAATPLDAPIEGRVAICVAVRNEDPARVRVRIAAMLGSLVDTGWADAFTVHVLSDSSAALEPMEAAAFQGMVSVQYRRRASNEGYKAGNLRAFAETADAYALMVVLDADSLMSGDAILRMVRVMQAAPAIGILQTLIVGRPAESAFTRMFQFGMRQGMRSHTVGAAWWQGPSGPFWGHNAIIRIRPFVDHCALPILPGGPPFGGPVLSHDQVEAVMIRAAGWEVRILADECGSWEENPPNLADFVRRNLRWIQGNLQYVHLVGRPWLRPMGRFQLANAVLMYAGPLAWTGMVLAGLLGALLPGSDGVPAAAFGAYLLMLALGFLPRVFGVIDALCRAGSRERYGGGARLLAGCAADAVATLLTVPVTMVSEAIFIAGLLLGHRIGWDAQQRDERSVPVAEAVRMFWPQTALGVGGTALLAAEAPGSLGWAAPVLLAWMLAVPYACLSASPAVGRWMRAQRLCAVPDEFEPDPVLRRLDERASG